MWRMRLKIRPDTEKEAGGRLRKSYHQPYRLKDYRDF